MSKNYVDEKTGLSVQLYTDGGFDITAPPAAPTLLPSVVFTGQATEEASAEDQINAFLKQFAAEQEAETTEAEAETTASTEEEDDKSQPKKGKLPEDFPYFEMLAAGEVTTYAKLRKRIEAGTLTEIEGIGDARAVEIEEAYNA